MEEGNAVLAAVLSCFYMKPPAHFPCTARRKMSLTAPGCPVAGEMPGWVADAVEPIAGVKQVNVALVWEPPWGMDMMSDEARLELGFM